MNVELPYDECLDCKDLGDCKHPDVALDGLGTALPPDCCPYLEKIMRATVRKRKKLRDARDSNRNFKALRTKRSLRGKA